MNLLKTLQEEVKKSLDKPGQEDGDLNNDGKKDETDEYLLKRRKAINFAIKSKKFKKKSKKKS
jgi:hypothetical protein